MTELITHTPAPLAGTLDRAAALIEETTPANTRRAYRADWAHFSTWCEQQALASLPAELQTVIAYLLDCAEQFKLATVERRLVSIGKAHRTAQQPDPTKTEQIHLVMKGIRRKLGRAQRQAAPAVTETIRAMLAELGKGPHADRDRALLLLGFAGALRRSELVGLDLADVQFTSAGAVVTLRRSKTDQEGEGRQIGIPYGLIPTSCPVRALRTWCERAEISSGPIFRPIDRHGNIKPGRLTGSAVARIIKRAAGAAGLDAEQFSGHSLRAGLATAAAAAGASERAIMKQTGHKSTSMARRYIRSGELFKENAAGAVGL